MAVLWAVSAGMSHDSPGVKTCAGFWVAAEPVMGNVLFMVRLCVRVAGRSCSVRFINT